MTFIGIKDAALTMAGAVTAKDTNPVINPRRVSIGTGLQGLAWHGAGI